MGTFVLYMFLTASISVAIDTTTQQPVVQPWTLPVFPSKNTPEKPLPQPHYFKSYSINESVDVATAGHSGKLIPRYIWIAVKNASAELNYQIPELFKRNPLWRGFVCGNDEKVSHFGWKVPRPLLRYLDGMKRRLPCAQSSLP